MGRLLIDYTFDDTAVANPDGTMAIDLAGATRVEGPGDTALGRLDAALELAARGPASVDLGDADPGTGSFAIRVVVRPGATDERQWLVSGETPAFGLAIEPGDDHTIRVVGRVQASHGWRELSSRFTLEPAADDWHVVDLVHDGDTAVLLVDGEPADVHALLDGPTTRVDGSRLTVAGGSGDGDRPFAGAIAALQVHDGIPEALQQPIDGARDRPRWFISHKVETIRARVDLGAPRAGVEHDDTVDAWIQPHEHGSVLYEESAGAAFELHGGIHDRWQELGSKDRHVLGPLLGDEEHTRHGGGRRSLFRGGSIYWVRGAGAVLVTGQLHRDYELGDAMPVIGLPVEDAETIPHGHVQQFRSGRMYHREGEPHAHWVAGAILEHYLATGGVGSWGFPVSDEKEVVMSGRRGAARPSPRRKQVRDHRDGGSGERRRRGESTRPRVRDHRDDPQPARQRARDERQEQPRRKVRDHRREDDPDAQRDARSRAARRDRDRGRGRTTVAAERGATGRARVRDRDGRDEPGLPDRPDRPDVPDSDEDGSSRPSRPRVVGKMSEFERATIWWSRDTGAHEVHGAIREAYRDAGGPTGPLGFPTSDEHDIPARFGGWTPPAPPKRPTPPGPGPKPPRDPREPGQGPVLKIADTAAASARVATESERRAARPTGLRPDEPGLPDRPNLPDPPRPPGDGSGGGRTSPGRISTFEHGSVAWYREDRKTLVVPRFRLFLDRIDTDESERIGMGTNDLHAWVTVTVEGEQVHHARHPGSDSTFPGGNVVDISLPLPPTITPDDADLVVDLEVDVRESDPGPDDHLGVVRWRLHAGNAWGLREDQGIMPRGPVKQVNEVVASVHLRVDASQLGHEQKFWGTDNEGSDEIDWREYAAAFPQVDSDTEWYDVGDWLAKAYHELVVEGLAEDGNCVGMAVEAIHARRGTSVFSLPLDRFDDWSVLEEPFNIRHAYQVGLDPILWFLGQFLSGNTHDPRDVFTATQRAFQRGDHPVLCLTKDYDFGGDPHCVLPVAWHDRSKPWTITISDPNDPQDLHDLEVDPDANTYRYVRGGDTYEGGAWTGGRLHYLPFHVLDRPQRLPVGRVLQLLANTPLGLAMLVGDIVRTAGITDDDGNDLDATGESALQELQAGRAPEGRFLRYRGFNDGARRRRGGDPVGGELWFQLGTLDGSAARRQPRDYRHELVGVRAGTFDYAVDLASTQVRLRSSMAADEPTAIRARQLGTTRQQLQLQARTDKQVSLEVTSRLGSSGDHVRMTVADVPVTADRPLDVNVKPGLAGIELAGAEGRFDAPVDVEARIDGRTTRQRFTVDVAGGTRLRPASAVSRGELGTAHIEALFAPASDLRAVTAD